jgi:hypothetical protein
MTELLLDKFINKKIRTGADIKVLQYEDSINHDNICDTQINIINSIPIKNNNLNNSNCIMINIEKDIIRYHSAVNELKKISINNFVHLKATYWKEKIKLEEDLNLILNFLRQFNSNISNELVIIDDFSESNDININIQDGPLACYCSHLRAMIYGYYNFTDYTIIVEDDLSIINTELIETYIKCIPDDWDIICLNSAAKNKTYDEPYYKFTDSFHSTHFYIIKNKSLPYIFKNMYPITDQVDVLISNLIHDLNIYNIPKTVYQKNYSTNTQNNLNTIFTSPNYVELRSYIKNMEKYFKLFINKLLPENELNNDIIITNLIYNVIYLDIVTIEPIIDQTLNKDNYETYDNSEFKTMPNYSELYQTIYIIIMLVKKGINNKDHAERLLNNILFILKQFTLHNTIDETTGEIIKAYSYGSTCNVYILSLIHI